MTYNLSVSRACWQMAQVSITDTVEGLMRDVGSGGTEWAIGGRATLKSSIPLLRNRAIELPVCLTCGKPWLDPQHRRGNRNKAHRRLFSVRNTTHRLQGLSTRAQASWPYLESYRTFGCGAELAEILEVNLKGYSLVHFQLELLTSRLPPHDQPHTSLQIYPQMWKCSKLKSQEPFFLFHS